MFSEKLIELRRSKGLSQEALAERLGVSRQAVSKWERNEAQPELSKIIALCDLFEVSPNELLAYEQEKPADQKAETEKSNHYRAVFWLVIGCMGFIVTAFCLGWAIAHPHIYNGIKGLRGSLLGNDCMEAYIIGLVAMVFGLMEAYFEITKKESFFAWLKKETLWLLNQIFHFHQ